MACSIGKCALQHQESSVSTSDMAKRYQTKKILPGIKARASEEN